MLDIVHLLKQTEWGNILNSYSWIDVGLLYIEYYSVLGSNIIVHSEHLGSISQRDLSPDLDLSLRLWS